MYATQNSTESDSLLFINLYRMNREVKEKRERMRRLFVITPARNLPYTGDM